MCFTEISSNGIISNAESVGKAASVEKYLKWKKENQSIQKHSIEWFNPKVQCQEKARNRDNRIGSWKIRLPLEKVLLSN